MIPALIFTFSLCALGQFALAYCQSLLLAYAKVEISEKTLQLIGANREVFEASDFNRLMVLARKEHNPADDVTEIRTIKLYQGFLQVVRFLVSPLGSGATGWFDGDLLRCTHFAAVTLDRRLSSAPQ